MGNRAAQRYLAQTQTPNAADACVQAFFASPKSWRERKKAGDQEAKPPHRRRWYFRVEYKRSALKLEQGQLRPSNGKKQLSRPTANF
jgi:putative transposase